MSTDSHPIVPDEFLEAYPEADSVAEALRRAKFSTSTTPDEDRDRCPSCGTPAFCTKTGKERAQKKDGDYRCKECGEHFSQPA